MLVLETTTLTRIVPDAVAGYMTVTKPNGVVEQDLSAIVSPSGSQKILSIDYTPDMGGKYKIVWKWVTTDNVVKTYPSSFVATWNEVYGTVRDLLQSGSLSPSDITLDRNFNDIYTEIKTYASPMPDYWNFSIDYQNAYDEGVPYLIAARVRPTLGSKAPTGEMTLFKKGTTTLQYSVGIKSKSQLSIEDQWIDIGRSIIMGTIVEFANSYVNDQTQDITPTRGELSPHNRHHSYTNRDGTGYIQGYCEEMS